MKVEGTEEEMRHLFKEKKQRTKELGKFWKRNESIIVIGLVFIAAIISIAVVYQFYMSEHYLTQTECNSQVRAALVNEQQGMWNKIGQIILPLLPLVVTALALGWIIHGVGFRIF